MTFAQISILRIHKYVVGNSGPRSIAIGAISDLEFCLDPATTENMSVRCMLVLLGNDPSGECGGGNSTMVTTCSAFWRHLVSSSEVLVGWKRCYKQRARD